MCFFLLFDKSKLLSNLLFYFILLCYILFILCYVSSTSVFKIVLLYFSLNETTGDCFETFIKFYINIYPILRIPLPKHSNQFTALFPFSADIIIFFVHHLLSENYCIHGSGYLFPYFVKKKKFQDIVLHD